MNKMLENIRHDHDGYGLLDKCSCGEKAVFVIDDGVVFHVECESCGDCTLKYKRKSQAMVEWNQNQRKHRKKT